MVNELDKRQYMMSKLGKRITQMIGLFVNSREEEGKNYTREDIINGIKSSTDMLAKKYPAVNDKFVGNCVDYFIKKNGNDLSFLIEGRSKKSNVINESVIREVVSETLKMVLNEIWYNQFSDDDFGGTGDPYGMVDSEMEETNDSLDGYYDTFNNISVRIMNDGKPDVSIEISTKRPGNGDKKVSFNGEKAQMLIDKIKDESEEHGNINISMYRNLYKYVL